MKKKCGKGRRGRRTKEMVSIAKERIKILFSEADRCAHNGMMDRAKRYVYLAKKIGMRYNVRLLRHLKRRVCKKCGAYLIPGKNCMYRLRNRKIVLRCLVCENIMRHRYG